MIVCFLMNFQINLGKQYYSNVILHNTILLLKEYCPLIIILVLLLLILVVIDFQIPKYIHDGIMPPINLYELGFDKVYIKIINSSNYISIRLVFCPTVRYCNGWTNSFSKMRGEFPNWSFDDVSDPNARQKLINIANRFVAIYRKGQ